MINGPQGARDGFEENNDANIDIEQFRKFSNTMEDIPEFAKFASVSSSSSEVPSLPNEGESSNKFVCNSNLKSTGSLKNEKINGNLISDFCYKDDIQEDIFSRFSTNNTGTPIKEIDTSNSDENNPIYDLSDEDILTNTQEDKFVLENSISKNLSGNKEELGMGGRSMKLENENVLSDSFVFDETVVNNFNNKLGTLKEKVNSLLKGLETLENLKDSLFKNAKVSPCKKEDFKNSKVNQESSLIPEIIIDDSDDISIEEPVMKMKEKLSIKNEVDNMLSSFKEVSIEKEIGQFGKLIRNVECLHFLKPRFSEVIGRGNVSNRVLVGLYRIANRFLMEDIKSKKLEIQRTKNEFKKYKERMQKINDFIGCDNKEKPKEDNEKKLEIENLNNSLRKKSEDIEKLNKRIESLQNDFNNYRNRQNKDIELKVDKEREEIILDMLRVVDNFERALQVSKNTQNINAIIEGFKMIYEQFMGILKNYKLKEIAADGCPFDPRFHEAVANEETFEYPEGAIVSVILKGYTLKDKVIRASQVKTSTLPPPV